MHAWDEAVAFYTGTLEGTAHPGTSDGVMLYRLAQKRCVNFGTCDATGVAIVNKNIFESFALGRDSLRTYMSSTAGCERARAEKDRIVRHMLVPQIQGMLRYAYFGDKVHFPDAGSKQRGEGHTFAQAILPMIDSCSRNSAAAIARNMQYDAETYVEDGYKEVFKYTWDVLECLQLTCDDIGGVVASTANGVTQYVAGTSPAECKMAKPIDYSISGGSGSSSSNLESGAIVGISVGAVFVASVLALFAYNSGVKQTKLKYESIPKLNGKHAAVTSV